jgi:SET domain
MNEYEKALYELGLDAETVEEMSKSQHDVIPFNKDFGVAVEQSKIHGNGLFAKRFFHAWMVICPARVSNRRTPAGRYINHEEYSNAVMIRLNQDMFVLSVREIKPGDEVTVDYRQSYNLNKDIYWSTKSET